MKQSEKYRLEELERFWVIKVELHDNEDFVWVTLEDGHGGERFKISLAKELRPVGD